jgi:hypothetical protein
MKNIKFILLSLLFFFVTKSHAQEKYIYAQCTQCKIIAKVLAEKYDVKNKEKYPCAASPNVGCQFSKLCWNGTQKWVCSNCGEKVYSSGQRPENGGRCRIQGAAIHNWEKK